MDAHTKKNDEEAERDRKSLIEEIRQQRADDQALAFKNTERLVAGMGEQVGAQLGRIAAMLNAQTAVLTSLMTQILQRKSARARIAPT